MTNETICTGTSVPYNCEGCGACPYDVRYPNSAPYNCEGCGACPDDKTGGCIYPEGSDNNNPCAPGDVQEDQSVPNTAKATETGIQV
jgi:hypothetical protein